MPSQDARERPRDNPDPIHCDSAMDWTAMDTGSETHGTVF